MKKRNVITALALTIALGVGATAYAATSDSTAQSVQGQRLGLGRVTAMRGYDYTTNVLKNKLGLSEKEITEALNSGKTVYELALEKGMTEESFKAALLEERAKAIDEAVTKGTITKEEAETLKANMKTNIQSCEGNFGQRQGQGRGNGRGMMGGGQGRGCLAAPNNGTVK